ncbi:EamA family transporter [Brevibacterium sp. UMB1308A]|uniref:EamA family transporter n=1 Tax=Brevibacterium sp. UMB1308A TaxID=3050608 RepID=UPI00254CE893|nr:EamA family transporter [Brevibacterium sp. UMB1308A]MDK8346144.1 EamA family transporter [Brevibacterium sp. UMB1308B]MDK8712422.1 EamA family transporter [Brevibacterium sp. UMB1308A]
MTTRPTLWGFILTLISVVAFALAAPIAKTMYASDWSAGGVTFARLTGCSVLLTVPALWAMRGKWHNLKGNYMRVIMYGVITMAGVQLLFFLAVERLKPSIALLLEMTAPILIVLFLWVRTRVNPAIATLVGMVVAMAGVVIVLDPRGATLDMLGVLYALAAAGCLATFFVMSARSDMGISPVPLLAFGMGVGAIVVGIVCAVGLVPFKVAYDPVTVAHFTIPWWAGVLAIVAVTILAYVTGVIGLQLIGATVGSFLNLLEVPASVVASWWMLGDLPTYVQLCGGIVVLAGVVFVKLGENQQTKRERVRIEDIDPATGQIPVIVEEPDEDEPEPDEEQSRTSAATSPSQANPADTSAEVACKSPCTES